ncbi:hypothetical protein BDV95DRAFT_301539 [Massariosphaeria phaeospora]|uniref:Uncharacterized protein n=1 Tax=Massariosphaeria phaeospora TaxID=100035 RepID=A0A7C8MJL1_9PLEO|nr:hypothetical protein BDV95DRAFT_301539 [Massariosphaeria phaeospora]
MVETGRGYTINRTIKHTVRDHMCRNPVQHTIYLTARPPKSYNEPFHVCRPLDLEYISPSKPPALLFYTSALFTANKRESKVIPWVTGVLKKHGQPNGMTLRKAGAPFRLSIKKNLINSADVAEAERAVPSVQFSNRDYSNSMSVAVLAAYICLVHGGWVSMRVTQRCEVMMVRSIVPCSGCRWPSTRLSKPLLTLLLFLHSTFIWARVKILNVAIEWED